MATTEQPPDPAVPDVPTSTSPATAAVAAAPVEAAGRQVYVLRADRVFDGQTVHGPSMILVTGRKVAALWPADRPTGVPTHRPADRRAHPPTRRPAR